MDVAGLKSHIKTNTLPSVLYFTGDEWAVQKIFIQQIARTKGMEIKRVNSITEVINKFKSVSFVQKNYIYVARDDHSYITDEKIQALLPTVIGKNMFILLLTNPDKRTKFYKAIKDDIVEFEALPEKMLVKYIQKEINLSEKNCKKLIEVCESDYGRILLEIDKIRRFDHEMTIGKDNAFEHLLYEGIIYTPPKDAIFDFVDAIINAGQLEKQRW